MEKQPVVNHERFNWFTFIFQFKRKVKIWLIVFFAQCFFSRPWRRLGLFCPLSGGHPLLRRCWHLVRGFGSFWRQRGVHCKDQGQVLSECFLSFDPQPTSFSRVFWFLVCDWKLWLCLQLFELGPDGGDHETDGDLLAETDVLAYDCAARYAYTQNNITSLFQECWLSSVSREQDIR